LYRAFLEAFYETVAEHSGRKVIVDSSGSPFHGHVLSGVSKVEATMIHLVRDARAVVFSNRRKKPNPSNPRQGAKMRRKLSIKVCTTWTLYNLLFENLSGKFDGYYRIKYEEVFANPKRNFAKLVSQFRGGEMNKNKFLSNKKIKLTKRHIGQGNPVRYKSGVTELEPDTEWKSVMSVARKKIVKVLCNRLLDRYEYL
jgi:hypothetical protein